MEHISFQTILLSLVLACAVAFVAYRLGSLSRSGAMAAIFVGGSIFALTGWKGSIALLFFFLSGSLLTRLPSKRQLEFSEDKAGRSWDQVLANGIVPVLACYALLNDTFAPLASYAVMGALATATADTWATEIGSRYASKTFDPITFRTFERGRSGGVSMYGLLASLAGALAIALLALPQMRDNYLTLTFATTSMVVIAVSGLVGAYLDSILGRTMQAVFSCDHCNATVEVRQHCGQKTRRIKGFRAIDNSVVNLLATIGGSLLAMLLAGSLLH
jgi:uncharacterized protein (TIGR00297 family)